MSNRSWFESNQNWFKPGDKVIVTADIHLPSGTIIRKNATFDVIESKRPRTSIQGYEDVASVWAVILYDEKELKVNHDSVFYYFEHYLVVNKVEFAMEAFGFQSEDEIKSFISSNSKESSE